MFWGHTIMLVNFLPRVYSVNIMTWPISTGFKCTTHDNLTKTFTLMTGPDLILTLRIKSIRVLTSLFTFKKKIQSDLKSTFLQSLGNFSTTHIGCFINFALSWWQRLFLDDRALTFHSNSLLWGEFEWNVQPCLAVV